MKKGSYMKLTDEPIHDNDYVYVHGKNIAYMRTYVSITILW